MQLFIVNLRAAVIGLLGVIGTRETCNFLWLLFCEIDIMPLSLNS